MARKPLRDDDDRDDDDDAGDRDDDDVRAGARDDADVDRDDDDDDGDDTDDDDTDDDDTDDEADDDDADDDAQSRNASSGKAPDDDDADVEAPPEREEPIDKRLTRWARIGVPVGVVVLAAVAGLTLGAPAVVLVLACGALVAVIAVFWASLRTLVGETPLEGADAYALGAPRTEEEQKRAVLRALKDLEFERSVGKISEEDYAALVGRYRTEAKRLLRLLDAEAAPRRRRVEGLVAERLKAAGLVAAAAPTAEPPKVPKAAAPAPSPGKPEPTGKGRKKKDRRNDAARVATSKAAAGERGIGKPTSSGPGVGQPTSSEPRVCASCQTTNDADAVFCKKCGARCAPESGEETASHAEEA